MRRRLFQNKCINGSRAVTLSHFGEGCLKDRQAIKTMTSAIHTRSRTLTDWNHIAIGGGSTPTLTEMTLPDTTLCGYKREMATLRTWFHVLCSSTSLRIPMAHFLQFVLSLVLVSLIFWLSLPFPIVENKNKMSTIYDRN